jgi:hypothetical protein
MLLFASYYDEVGLTLGQIWLLVVGIPVIAGAVTFGRIWFVRRTHGLTLFDPTSPD